MFEWEKKYDEWVNTYEPMPNLFAPMQNGVYVEDKFETYGEELDHVLNINAIAPNRVWTLVEGDDSNLYIVSGMHFVNRLNYFITAYPCELEYEEYPYFIFEEEEDEELSDIS